MPNIGLTDITHQTSGKSKRDHPLIKSPILRLGRPHVCQQVPWSCEWMVVLLWHLLPVMMLGNKAGSDQYTHLVSVLPHPNILLRSVWTTWHSQLCNIRIQIKVLAVSPALTTWWWSWNLQTNQFPRWTSFTIQRMLLQVWRLLGPTCSLSCWELLMIRVASCGGYSGTTG